MLSARALEALSGFGLTPSQLKVLSAASEAGRGYTAEELREAAGLPKGRVYSVLKELVSLRLLRQLQSRPSMFAMETPEEFVESRLEEFFNRRAQLLSEIYSEGPVSGMAIIHEQEEYVSSFIEAYNTSSPISMIQRADSIPFVIMLYPDNQKASFTKFRTIYRQKGTSLFHPGSVAEELNWVLAKKAEEHAKKLPDRCIMSVNGLLRLRSVVTTAYGKKEWPKYLKFLKNKLANTPFRIRVLRHHSLSNIMIAPDRVITVTAINDKPLGFIAKSRDVARMNQIIFESMWSSSVPMENYLAKKEFRKPA